MKASFTFAVELTAGDMEPDRIEDIIYNCLDFCELDGLTPYFCISSDAGISELWPTLELLHEAGADFSLLTGPERAIARQTWSAANSIRIDGRGSAFFAGRSIGNILEDRLADLWVEAGLKKEVIL